MWQKSKIYALGLLAAAFAAGIAVGAGVSRTGADARRGEPGGRARPQHESYAARLEHELGLTPTQRDSVDRVLDAYQDSMSAMWATMRPRMDTLRARIREDIFVLLDATQQERYRSYMQRTDSLRAARENGGRRERR